MPANVEIKARTGNPCETELRWWGIGPHSQTATQEDGHICPVPAAGSNHGILENSAELIYYERRQFGQESRYSIFERLNPTAESRPANVPRVRIVRGRALSWWGKKFISVMGLRLGSFVELEVVMQPTGRVRRVFRSPLR
jgi:hypothetical protein